MDGIQERMQEELNRKKAILLRELRERALWFIRLRWWVPPFIVAGTVLARWIGVDFPAGRVMLVAVLVLTYNIVFHAMSLRYRTETNQEAPSVHRFACWQVGLDYSAMFLLIHFTGGAASPLIFFFIFHIIFTSILLPPSSAYGFSALVVFGMTAIALAEYQGWIPNYLLLFKNRSINLAHEPFHVVVELGFFAASVLITVFSTSAIMTMLRKRILDLGELSESVSSLNKKFNALFSMIRAIISAQHLDQVLNLVTTELQHVMNVRGISIKLLSEDGRFLRYASAYGLPEELFMKKEVEVDKSPLNRRIIKGEPYLTGEITQKEQFQFGEALAAAHIKSVLFVPLTVEEKVIGILGAYCVFPDRFSETDVTFFRLAAGLVAIALENAEAYEAVEKISKEKAWYTMRVTHNLRAPLSAMVSILEAVRGGYLGELNDNQQEYLRRLDRRARTMLSMINELMTLTRSQDTIHRKSSASLDLTITAGRILRTFQNQTAEKNIDFKVLVPDKLPAIRADADMIEQMLENLVSNAVKYTPAGGRVTVSFSSTAKSVRIEISDTGIGIPQKERANLFTEFFRAENARAMEAHGTGLGLAIVKQIMDRYGGWIFVESEEGLGTVFAVHFPVDPSANSEPETGKADSAASIKPNHGHQEDVSPPMPGRLSKTKKERPHE